jgi:murein L,D-transpeptidase YcbB/YkuD
MRYWNALVVLGAVASATVMVPAPAGAQLSDHHAVVATADPGADIAPGVDDDEPIGAAIRDRLLDDAVRAKEDEAVDWQALLAFYEGRGDKAIWVGRAGYTGKALSVMAEFATADEWGLNPDDFSVLSLPDDGPDTAPLTRDQRIEAESRFALNCRRTSIAARRSPIQRKFSMISLRLKSPVTFCGACTRSILSSKSCARSIWK